MYAYVCVFCRTITLEEQVTGYRYVLNVDGIGIASRLRTQLAAGALVFKVDSPLKAHYMEGFQPWVHYVPVSWGEIETDLPLKVRWAIQHDEAARRIAKAGRDFAVETLSDASTAWYMQQVVRAIAQRQAASGEPFDLLPGVVPFCCSDLESIPRKSQRVKIWIDACASYTAGREQAC